MDCTSLFREAKNATKAFSILSEQVINKTLFLIAEAAVENTKFILEENQKDLDLMQQSDPRYDRLILTPGRIESIAADIRHVAELPSPIGHVLSKDIRQNGLKISRISVPFGVVGIIYESRPNVTFDVFSLCLKSGNVCILKGGSDAIHSNTAIVKVIKEVLRKNDIDQNILILLPAGRDETIQLLKARKYVDLIIPRGSRNLI